MAVVQVTDKYFDIVLSSNAFQNYFPANTVSHFRAKLPVTLMLPPNVPFRVALHKLTFINAINNIGLGANTKLWISTDSVNPLEIHIPDVSIDDIEVFIAFLSNQIKAAAPTLFPPSDLSTISIQKPPLLIRPRRSLLNNVSSVEMQSDQPEPFEPLRNANIQETYDSLADMLNILCANVFNFGQDPKDTYMRFAAYMRHEIDNLLNLLSEVADDEILWNQYFEAGVYNRPYPHIFLKQILNWLVLCYSTYIEPFLNDSAFSQTEASNERTYDFVLHIQDQAQRSYFKSHPDLKQRFYSEEKKIIDSEGYKEFMIPFKVLKNLNGDVSYLDDVRNDVETVRDNTKAHLAEICQARIAQLKTKLDTLNVAIESLWANPPSTETMLQMVEDYVRLKNWKFFAQKQFPNILTFWENKNEINRPSELTVLNPLTNIAFTSLKEYQAFMLQLNQKSQINNEPSAAVYARLSNQTVQTYVRKRKLGLITESTPYNEMTGDEIHFHKREFLYKVFDISPPPPPPQPFQPPSPPPPPPQGAG